jgi:hypothetical protein
MKIIEVACCEGDDKSGRCLKDRCPMYRKAKEQIQSNWPYTGTGFGNLHGDPSHQHFLNRVKRDIEEEQK